MANATKSRSGTTGRGFRCHVCVEHGLECDGKALPGFKVERLPVCKIAATFYFNQQREHVFRMIADLGRKAKGQTRSRIGRILSSMRGEVLEIFVGDAAPRGVGSVHKALDRIADLLADARFEFAASCLEEAKEAAAEHLGRLKPAKADAVRNVLGTVESHLELRESDPKEMKLPARRGYWGAAKQALVLVDGLPESISRLSGISADRFRERVLSGALGVSPAEARNLMRKLRESQADQGAEREEPAAAETEAPAAEPVAAEEVAETPPPAAPTTGGPPAEDKPARRKTKGAKKTAGAEKAEGEEASKRRRSSGRRRKTVAETEQDEDSGGGDTAAVPRVATEAGAEEADPATIEARGQDPEVEGAAGWQQTIALQVANGGLALRDS